MVPQSPDLQALGALVRQRRHDLHLTQEELGKRVGWAQERISTLENAKYGLPSLPMLGRLARALDIPLQDILSAVGFESDSVGRQALDAEAVDAANDNDIAAILLLTLENLLAIQAMTLRDAMSTASDLMAQAMGAEKIDAFLYEPVSETLVALGTSDTPMGREQVRLGLNRHPLADHGALAGVFTSGVPFHTGRADLDETVSRGEVEALGVRSIVAIPLTVNGETRGVLAAASSQPDRFTQDEQRFFQAAGQWVGIVAHRAELHEETTRRAAEEGRRVAAEEILAVASHDLRNPMAAVKGRIELVLRRLRREGNERDATDIAEAARSLGRLERMLADLLDASRLDAGLFALDRSPLDLMQVLKGVVDDMPRGRGEVVVRGPDTLTVQADPARISQVFHNVMANAMQHTPPGTPVVVTVGETEQEAARWASVEIHDEGPGIGPDILPRLFTRHVTGSGSGGLGLGLYLARGIIDAHGGRITVTSEAGAGTTFHVLLPLD